MEEKLQPATIDEFDVIDLVFDGGFVSQWGYFGEEFMGFIGKLGVFATSFENQIIFRPVFPQKLDDLSETIEDFKKEYNSTNEDGYVVTMKKTAASVELYFWIK